MEIKRKTKFILCAVCLLLTLTAGLCGESFEDYDTIIYCYNSKEDTVWVECRYPNMPWWNPYFCKLPPRQFLNIGSCVEGTDSVIVYAVDNAVYHSHSVEDIMTKELYDSTVFTNKEIIDNNYIISYPFKND